MNEAHKPTGSPFSEVFSCDNSTQVKPANCCDAELPDEQQTAVEYAAAEPFDVSVCPGENFPSVRWSAFSSCVETAESGVASLSPNEVASLVTLIQEMRCSNTNLLERVIQLEQAIAKSQSDLHSYKQRSRAAESMLDQQVQDLTDAKEQAKSLSDELEIAHHNIKRQQILIENLTTQLTNSQERIAQMERECSLTQTNYNEKFHHLMQTENSCRELRARLIRQQRYTMQLKFALEKCLEAPVRGYQSQSDSDSMAASQAIGQAVYAQAGQSWLPKAQPITPWSSQAPSFTDDLEHTWTESYIGSQWNSDKSTSCPGSFELESNTTTGGQSFFFTQEISATEDTNWEDLFGLFEAEVEKDTARSAADLLVDTVASAADVKDLNQVNEQLERANFAGDRESNFSVETVTETTNRSQPLETPQPQTTSSTVNPNWPSPLVNPLHPPKGKKSLSAIELPSFVNKKATK